MRFRLQLHSFVEGHVRCKHVSKASDKVRVSKCARTIAITQTCKHGYSLDKQECVEMVSEACETKMRSVGEICVGASNVSEGVEHNTFDILSLTLSYVFSGSGN